MKTPFLIPLLFCLSLCIGGAGCKRQPSDFPLSLEAVRQIDRTNTTKMSFEEKDGFIIVCVTDTRGFIHLHEMSYDDSLSKEQVLEILKRKQAELERRP
jgi:hypothetical protein